MTNHNDGYDNIYNGGNEEGNDDDNATSGSGSDGPIFDPIATPWSRLGIAEDDWATTTMVMRPRQHVYLRVGIYIPYKYPINAVVNMCHKLMYTKLVFWTYAAKTPKKYLK